MRASGRQAWTVAAALSIAVLLSGGGCDTSPEPTTVAKRIKIAMITEWDGGSFWSVVKKGAEQAARDLDIDLTYSTADGDHERQAQLIASAVTLKVDGIAVSAADPRAIASAVQQARAAGIPVITLNSGAEQSAELGAVAHVGQTETIAGRQAGQRLGATGAKKLLCVNGEAGNVGQIQRCQGAQQGFGGTTEVVNVKGVSDLATTLTELQSKLRADQQIDAVLTLNPDIAIAARDAIKAAGSTAKLGTFDLSNNVMSAIRAGEIQFAIDQQPYLQGYLPVSFLKLYQANGDVVGGGAPVLTGPAFVDKSNVDKVEKLVAQGTR